MHTPRPPFWYRHAWWFPATFTAITVPLTASTLRPTDQTILLAVAILCALPWSFALLLLDFSAGFADRASFVVFIGLSANAAILWWATAVLRERTRDRIGSHRTLEA